MSKRQRAGRDRRRAEEARVQSILSGELGEALDVVMRVHQLGPQQTLDLYGDVVEASLMIGETPEVVAGALRDAALRRRPPRPGTDLAEVVESFERRWFSPQTAWSGPDELDRPWRPGGYTG